MFAAPKPPQIVEFPRPSDPLPYPAPPETSDSSPQSGNRSTWDPNALTTGAPKSGAPEYHAPKLDKAIESTDYTAPKLGAPILDVKVEAPDLGTANSGVTRFDGTGVPNPTADRGPRTSPDHRAPTTGAPKVSAPELQNLYRPTN